LVGDLTGEAGRALHEALSDRELQVLRLLGSGKTVSEIADQICLSVKTVSTYRARLLEKLRLTTTAQLIRYALHHKLVE
jgi:DNA-binding NarL/FixJ family response regulator